MEIYNSKPFFSDGKRIIDFILVYHVCDCMAEEKVAKLERFFQNLHRGGLDLEGDPFTADKTIYFVKIHGARDTLIRYAAICDIDLAYQSSDYLDPIRPMYNFMATPVTPMTAPVSDDSIYERAPRTISGSLPVDITSAERIMVVYKILNKTKFGPLEGDYGIDKLVHQNVFADYFPLHEGHFEWSEDGRLTDRQLLAQFWGSPSTWYKEQPLNLIQKYYGTEYAFYFAWLGMYVKMLFPIAILSVIFLLYGLITMKNAITKEICDSTIIMCPRCHYEYCKYEKLSSFCTASYLTYLCDNTATIIFAVLISIWSTLFMELWERNQAILQLHWNVESLEYDMSLRPEYIENSRYYTRFSPVTGEREYYTPKGYIIARYALTSFTVALMLAIMVLATFGVMIYRITVRSMLLKDRDEEIVKNNISVIPCMSGSLMSACQIIIFSMIYPRVALMLTKLENHRTQYQFDHSYIFKTYALAFTNNYSAVFYIAFFKGIFYTHPGDLSLWSNFGGISSDICDPPGCILDVTVQLTFIMLLKMVFNNFVQIVLPRIIKKINMYTNKVTVTDDMPTYEREYLMASTGRYFLVDEYIEMVIQYGFVVFFIAAFPLAPVLAFLNNVIEAKVDAYKITRSFRRPIPSKVNGLGAWLGILQGMTLLGVVTNALVIAFTSNFVSKEIYKYEEDSSLEGFVNTTISEYQISEFEIIETRSLKDFSMCSYPGKRYPPTHEKKYELTNDYWFLLAMRFLAVVIFEHIVITLKGILAYAIPDVPSAVREQIAIKEKEDKELRIKMINEQYKNERKSVHFDTGDFND